MDRWTGRPIARPQARLAAGAIRLILPLQLIQHVEKLIGRGVLLLDLLRVNELNAHSYTLVETIKEHKAL
jgi:hypothetical protein